MTEDQTSSTHPPLPPTTEDDRFAWLRLLRSRRVGVTTFHRLMAEHGTAQKALDALPEVAAQAGIKAYEICPVGRIEAELEAARAARAQLLCLGSADYPQQLATLPDAPPLLWAIGDVALGARAAVGLVGARNASSLGTRMARELGRALGVAGYACVSGLARGIDTAVHLASLEGGTIAVMGGGVDVIYPAENTDLAREIADRGLLLSEQPMGLQPMARHFPRRNRIIAGLSRAVIIVEAALKSGSLITARDALDQGREVMAVPGHPMDPRAAGCNALIRDGARLVRNAADILAELAPEDEQRPLVRPATEAATAPTPDAAPWENAEATHRSAAELSALHADILRRLGPAPLAEDQLIRDLRAPAGRLNPILTDLELRGAIARQPGGLLRRVS